MKATIWHNPRCSKSRQALAILEDAGAEVTVIDYLKNPPGAGDLKALYARAGMTPREGLRTAEAGAKPLKDADDAAILAAMAADPILIERPLVATDKGVVLGRPPEKVREIL
ncbi:arsenate reductase (glutaredoxin) [Hephaestia sp. GCM10023244]|uniref:arsenate reductase (glutaredoxin) n=1 Tax=unclassified Hephaestia TaxID=2631281 RepID=UPI0020776ADD|nr:arsenate reductase (glutaredoxin) [Hephaestia sp. MAHUQ-44]MCM8730784.1 arsenate reductase (glutaredoxin) [Hephaestia sp. MAHUQ-44]